MGDPPPAADARRRARRSRWRSFLLVPLIGTELMPQTDSGDFSISVKMPVGTALDETNEAMQQVEQIVQSNPNVQTAFAAAGSS